MPSLRKKNDGRYFVDYSRPRRNGKRKRCRHSLKTKNHAVAEKRFNAFIKSIEDAPPLPTNFDHDLESGNPELKSLATWYTETVMLARGCTCESRHIAGVRLDDVLNWLSDRQVYRVGDIDSTPYLLENWTAERLRTHKPTTVRTRLVTLKAVFNAAFEYRLIDSLPIRRWPSVRIPAPKYDELDTQELKRFLSELRTRKSAYTKVACFLSYTGARPSDAANLKWNDIIYDEGLVFAHFRQQKTREFVSVALSRQAQEVVEMERARQTGSEYVFTNAKGEPFPPRRISKALWESPRRWGFKNISAKTFRQTLVTILYDGGADDEMVRRITGHRSEAIRSYRKVRRSAAHELAQKFADVFDSETTEQVRTEKTGHSKAPMSHKLLGIITVDRTDSSVPSAGNSARS